VDTTTVAGGAVGAFVATLWSTAPVFLSGTTAAAITQNQVFFILLGTAIAAGSILYTSSFRNGLSIPKHSLYSGLAAFLIVGVVGYAALPVGSALQGQETPTGELTGDNLRVATLDVEGMYCQGCRLTVEKYLTSMEGTKQVNVSLSNKRSKVVYDADTVSAEQLANARVFQGTYSATVADDRQYRG
jgi:copper chaperone CopZ